MSALINKIPDRWLFLTTEPTDIVPEKMMSMMKAEMATTQLQAVLRCQYSKSSNERQSRTAFQFSPSGIPSLIPSGHSPCWASSQSCRWRSLQKAIFRIPGFAKGVIAGVNGPGSVTHFGSSGSSFPQIAHESGFSMRTIGNYVCRPKKGLRQCEGERFVP
jgi:hypothetical protein